MSCEHPNVFLDFGMKANGKRILKMFPKSRPASLESLRYTYGKDHVLLIPCGKCPSCIKSYRRQWAIRCEAEARLHDFSCFITLTYDEDHDPGHLVKDHLRSFIKALRNRGHRLRYFGCGEVSPAGRAHYHIILFGYFPSDCKPICKSKSGFWLYKSKYIDDLWSKGLCTIQEFDNAVAGYVAGYVDKKLPDQSGFLLMSNRPGIGYGYFRKHLDDLLQSDNFISKNGFIASLPRYVDKIADQCFYDISDLKYKRQRKAVEYTNSNLLIHGFDHLGVLYDYFGSLERSKKKYARSL